MLLLSSLEPGFIFYSMALPWGEEAGRVPERQISIVLLSGDHICSLHSGFDSGIAGRINHGGFAVAVRFGCSSSSLKQLLVKTCQSCLLSLPQTLTCSAGRHKGFVCVCLHWAKALAQAGWQSCMQCLEGMPRSHCPVQGSKQGAGGTCPQPPGDVVDAHLHLQELLFGG